MTASWKRKALPWVPAAGFALLIFVLSSLPGSAFPSVHFRFADKLAHGCIYGALGALIAWPLDKVGHVRGAMRHIVLAACLATIYGLSDEVHQMFTPLRSADGWDVVADAIGALIGAAGYVGVAKMRASSRA